LSRPLRIASWRARSSCRWSATGPSRSIVRSSSGIELVLVLGIKPDLTRNPVRLDDGHIKTQTTSRQGKGATQVELITVVVLITLGFAILGLAAEAFGVDSRPTMQDDWRRAW
jgi:hypothetical protein